MASAAGGMYLSDNNWLAKPHVVRSAFDRRAAGLACLNRLLALLVWPCCRMILRGDEAGVKNVGEIKLVDITDNQISDGVR